MLIKSTQTGLEMHRHISILSMSAKSISQKQYCNWSTIICPYVADVKQFLKQLSNEQQNVSWSFFFKCLIILRWRHLESLTSFTHAFVLRLTKNTYHHHISQCGWKYRALFVPCQCITTQDPKVP